MNFNNNLSLVLSNGDDQSQREKEIATAVQTILRNIGEDPGREGLIRTPQRFAKAMLFLTSGYHTSPLTLINNAIFNVCSNDIVMVRNINIASLCEHHLLPFTGRAHIGYLPNGQVLGLSKLARTIEMYARRLQIQERLTTDVAQAIQLVVEPRGVVVRLECQHLCMAMRGVQQVGTTTATECRTGVFERDTGAYDRFLALLSTR